MKKFLFSFFLICTSVFGQPDDFIPRLPFESEIIYLPRTDEIGDVRYENNGIRVNVNSTSPMPDAFMQVTIDEVKGLQQQESLYVTSAVNLTRGENTVFFPAPLQPGAYKLRIYLIQNGERKTAVIRDIVV